MSTRKQLFFNWLNTNKQNRNLGVIAITVPERKFVWQHCESYHNSSYIIQEIIKYYGTPTLVYVQSRMHRKPLGATSTNNMTSVSFETDGGLFLSGPLFGRVREAIIKPSTSQLDNIWDKYSLATRMT